MSLLPAALTILGFVAVVLAVGAGRFLRARNLQIWIGSYVKRELRRCTDRRPPAAPVDVLLCIADHFEPEWGRATDAVVNKRVATWVREYPRLFGEFRDSDGRTPRHSFFYPIDQYQPHHVDALTDLCAAGFGEIEIHLHHDNDTAENLRRTLSRFATLLAERHGLLGRWPDGRPAYGFIHGNWALDNSRPDGRWCGVRNELAVLQQTGCFADFTLPSAPDATQTRKINSIYYAAGSCCRPKSHDRGVDVGVAPPPPSALMLIQGPLRLWRPGGATLPRTENGCIQRGQPPSMERLEQWMRARVQVRSRPDWLFVKLHTHGAPEHNQRVLLGPPMLDFHRALAQRASEHPMFRYHYVTAREMYNLAKAAEAGWSGSVADALDFAVAPPRPHNALCPTFTAE